MKLARVKFLDASESQKLTKDEQKMILEAIVVMNVVGGNLVQIVVVLMLQELIIWVDIIIGNATLLMQKRNVIVKRIRKNVTFCST